LCYLCEDLIYTYTNEDLQAIKHIKMELHVGPLIDLDHQDQMELFLFFPIPTGMTFATCLL
jgi:hypothetical protein